MSQMNVVVGVWLRGLEAEMEEECPEAGTDEYGDHLCGESGSDEEVGR